MRGRNRTVAMVGPGQLLRPEHWLELDQDGCIYGERIG